MSHLSVTLESRRESSLVATDVVGRYKKMIMRDNGEIIREIEENGYKNYEDNFYSQKTPGV